MSGPPPGRGGVGAPPSSCAAKPLASVGIGAPPVPQAEAAAERRLRGSPPASVKRIIWAVLGYTELTTMSGPSRVTGRTEGPAESSSSRTGSHSSKAQASSSWRSEEHTSELQSRGHLVCRHLLEKKKRT